jgi:MFS family permease
MKNLISRILLVLVLAQFIIVIDTTFMNVSLSTLVVDLHTTVTGVQNAITLYALVMAALMIPGAKFGDIIGRKRAFISGLIVYAVGTTLTSLSWSLPVFVIGWSFLEGMGAALMLPAMMSLIADNFPQSQERAKAYATFAAAAGAAAALGPIVGGLFTTFLSWRLAFASELLVAIFIFSQRKIIQEQKLTGAKPKFDWLGFGLSATGLVIIVQGIILASTYGLIQTRQDFSFLGVTLQAGSISPTILFVSIGLLVMAAFAVYENRRNARGKDTLLDISLLKIRTINAGSVTQMIQALVLTAVIFALSLYVQMELGYNAIESGLTLLPLSVGVLLFSGIAARVLSKRYSPKSVMLVGFALIVAGVVLMGLTARDATSGLDFFFGLIFIGSGVGCVVSQNQNLMISSVSSEKTNETSGIINTFQNIGTSFGTSIAGAVILALFISTATSGVDSSSAFTSSQKSQLDQGIVKKAQIVSNQQLESKTANLPSEQQQAILSINAQARQKALTGVYIAIGAAGLIGIVSVALLPKTAPLGKAKETDEASKNAPAYATSTV